MTQEQYKWLQDNGYDPTVQDVDDQGNIFDNPINQTQQKEVMSMPRAFGTSFLGNLLPAGAGLGAGSLLAPLVLSNPWTGIPAVIAGSMAAAYGTGKGQQALLENYAPEAVAEMQRAETDQPVASWAGGSAPALLTFKPSFKGISGLSAPLMRGRDTFTKFDPATIARFTPAAVNVGVNAASAGAGQLINMSEGGDFSLPRFAADTAFGSIVSNPNAIGRRMGFPSLTPQRGPVERMDLAGENARRADIATMAEDVAASDRATELLGKEPSRSGPMFGPDARKFDIYENQKAVTEAFDKLGIEKNPETIQDFVNDPMLSNFRDDPAAVLDYVSEKTGLKSRSEAEINASEARRASEAFESEYAGKPTEFAAKPTEQPIDPRRVSVAENRKAIEEVLTKMKAAPPEEFMQDLANDPIIGNLRDDPQAFQDFIGQKADKYLEKSWQRSMDDINRISKNLEEGFGKEEVAEFDRAQARREEAKNLGIKDIQPARDAAEEIHQRFQRPAEEGPARITQEDLDAASEIAAMRGLKIQFEDLGGRRGKFQLQTPDGIPIISIDPSAATRDTAIHEIGHDVYSRSVGEGMRKGLVATAEDSPVFKAEYEARINARDKQGNPTHTEAQARDIALEEGLIQAFGEAYPNVKPGAIRQWFNALKASMKDLAGMKLSPEDASAYLYYLTNENVPWKGMAVAKTGDVGEETRYQRGLLEKIQTPSEMDALIQKGGPFERVGSTIRDASNTRDYKQGEWSSKYSLATKLRPDDQVRLFNHLAQEFDSGVRSAPATELRAAYDQLRNEYLPAIVNDYNAQGFTVRDTAGQRARGSNPTYIPLHAIADEVKTILTTLQGSPEYKKLENDFKQWNTQLRQADGATLQEAQNYANEKFEEKIQITAKTPGIESGIPFSGARKPEGYPLPPSWRSTDLISNLDNYTKRSATDFAYQKHVESSPEAMAALGAKTMVNNQPIPANILAATPNVINNDSVQSVLREYRGTPAQKNEGVLSGIGRSVSAATIGPVSKVGDIGTSLIKGLVYMPAGEYTSGLIDFTNRLGDWAALKERSYASGLNKRDAAQNMRQVLGIAEDSVNFMDKVARVISKGTGLNQLESVARTVAQAWGETVVKYNKTLALGGDKNALQMLDTLSPDWRTRSDADLSAQVGRLLQGSYDMRQLPASVLEGAAAPYLTWSKWSIGQYDSFVKYAMKPAMQGNVKPLIGQMLIGVLGGGAVSAVQEWLNNRQGKDISWKELESWMQQNQGQLGADGGQLLAQKLLTMAQKLGTFGFAGDIAKMTVDAASGGSAQGIATMPALDAIYDVSKRAAAAAKALDDGEDFGLVLQALLKDSVIGHMQVARVARNWLDEDENLRYDDRRSRRLYDELSGLPSKGGAFAVNYSNLSEREFERGDITEKTGEEAFNLVSRARQEATSGEDYASRIRKLKTSQNAIMPSLERQPQKAARYLSFVEGAEPGKGSETLKRYYTRQNEDKYRKSLIEGMSGIR